jgi:hypothetical protein
MWIPDDVYSPYIDVAVCFYALQLFAAPLLGTLRWDHAIPNVIKMLLRNENCDLLGFYAAQKPKKSAHLIYIAEED